MWVQSLAQEDPLEKEMAIHSSILCQKISVNRGAWWVHGVAESDVTEQACILILVLWNEAFDLFSNDYPLILSSFWISVFQTLHCQYIP